MERLYTNYTASGRQIVLNNVPASFATITAENIRLIFNETQKNVQGESLDPLASTGAKENITNVVYNGTAHTVIITLADNVPIIDNGDAITIKLDMGDGVEDIVRSIDISLHDLENAVAKETQATANKVAIMGGYLPSHKQYDELFAIASDHKYWILEDDGSLHQTEIVTPLHPTVGEVIDVPSIDGHLLTGYVITSYKSGTTDQGIIDLIESYDGHDAVDIQTLVNYQEVTVGLWRVKEVRHLGGEYDIDLFFYEKVNEGKSIKDVYNKFETVAKQATSQALAAFFGITPPVPNAVPMTQQEVEDDLDELWNLIITQ